MTIDEAIEVLELHNQWRKGAEIPQESPVRIGMAIDLVVCELKNLNKAHVMRSVCEKYPKPTQRYCYECEGCKKAMSEQTDA